MADSPVFCTERDLARTFDGGYYDDAWQMVDKYREDTAYASKHDVNRLQPQAPSIYLAREFGRGSTIATVELTKFDRRKMPPFSVEC